MTDSQGSSHQLTNQPRRIIAEWKAQRVEMEVDMGVLMKIIIIICMWVLECQGWVGLYTQNAAHSPPPTPPSGLYCIANFHVLVALFVGGLLVGIRYMHSNC